MHNDDTQTVPVIAGKPVRGIPVVISGPSGSGKGTVVAELLKRAHNYRLSVSATTRSPRPGELEGTHYYFITREAFEKRIAENRMLEYASYVGNYYGTPRDEVTQRLDAGLNVILEIEVQGALQIKKNLPEALLIFLVPPDAATLERRLRGRGTNTEADIQKRLSRAREEMALAGQYDYIVVNDEGEIGVTADRIAEIVRCEQCAVNRQEDFIRRYFTEE